VLCTPPPFPGALPPVECFRFPPSSECCFFPFLSISVFLNFFFPSTLNLRPSRFPLGQNSFPFFLPADSSSRPFFFLVFCGTLLQSFPVIYTSQKVLSPPLFMVYSFAQHNVYTTLPPPPWSMQSPFFSSVCQK